MVLTWQGHSGQAADKGVFDSQQVPVQSLRPELILTQFSFQSLLSTVHV
jgi:hypothetical protein